MLGLYEDFYCFYILINLQQAYKGSTEVLGFEVVGGSRPTATSVSHFTGNPGTTSLEVQPVGNTMTLNFKVTLTQKWPVPHNSLYYFPKL